MHLAELEWVFSGLPPVLYNENWVARAEVPAGEWGVPTSSLSPLMNMQK